MELEQAVLEAIKLKLEDTFKKVSLVCAVEGREVVIRISIPDEIMQINPNVKKHIDVINDFSLNSTLDKEAYEASKELLGNIEE